MNTATLPVSPDLCAPDLALRSLDRNKGTIRGYLAIWGAFNQRDCYQTWFDRNNPPELGLEFLPFPLFYGHGSDSRIGIDPVGKVVRTWVDNTGIGYEAELDKSHPAYDRIVREAETGELGTSSGSAKHLAEFDDQGRFRKWFLAEVSLTKNPCEPRMPSVTLRSLDTGAIADVTGDSPLAAGGENEQSAPEPNDKQPNESETLTMFPNGTPPMSDSEDPAAELADLVNQLGGVDVVMQLLQQMAAPAAMSDPAATPAATPAAPVAPVTTQPAPATPAVVTPAAATAAAPVEQRSTDNMQRQIDMLRVMLAGQAPAPQQPAVRDRRAPAVVSEYSRAYDNLSDDDMIVAAKLMSVLHDDRRMKAPPSEKFTRSLNTRLAGKLQRGEQDAIRSMPSNVAAIRANELMGSTVVSAGDEWVGIQYDNRLWNKIRQAVIYQELISAGLVEREVPQGFESIKILTEGADPTWYAVGQTASEDATGQPQTKLNSSKPGTGQQSLSAAKLGAAVVITSELEEDSLIPMMPQIRDMLDKSGQEQIENILINGDTETGANANINLIDSTPGAASLGGLPAYTLLDGFLKLALVTNTANKRDASGTLSEDDYLNTLKLMGTLGRDAIEKDRVVFLVDNQTYYKTLQLAVVKTPDKFTGATLQSGEIMQMWGRKMLVSGQLALANSAGKVPNAGGTLGRILAVRPDRWTLGWKRRATTEVQRWSRADSTEIVTYLRMGLAYFNNEASAVTYNVGV